MHKNIFRNFLILLTLNADCITIETTPHENNSIDKITYDNPPTIGTHSGTFHCDDVLACFMLRQLPEYNDAKILRTRNDEELRSKCNIVVDVGGEFDHRKKLYDHHQKSFNETFSSLHPELGDEFNKIRLSSTGLIYSFYGLRVIESILHSHTNIKLSATQLTLVYTQIYRSFISEIDAIDNGVQMFASGEPLYKISTHLSARVAQLNPSWEEDNVTNEVIDQRFHQAMTYVGKEFIDNVFLIGGSWLKARDYVREALEDAKSVYKTGEILVLSRFCPWQAHLADLEKEYNVVGIPKLIIYQGAENTWRVAGVPITPHSFLGRKFLPKIWRGLRKEELSKTTSIPNLLYVHHTGYLGVATTKEDAIALAIKSVEWPNNE